MDSNAIVTGVVTALIAVPAAGYAAVRYMRRANAADGAERFANDWHQKVIDRQDREAERLRAEIANLSDRLTITSKRMLELELDNKIKQKVIRDIVADIRMVKRDEIPIEQLHTGSYTGE